MGSEMCIRDRPYTKQYPYVYTATGMDTLSTSILKGTNVWCAVACCTTAVAWYAMHDTYAHQPCSWNLNTIQSRMYVLYTIRSRTRTRIEYHRICLMRLQKMRLYFCIYAQLCGTLVLTLFHDVDVRLITGHCPGYDCIVLITWKMLELQPV